MLELVVKCMGHYILRNYGVNIKSIDVHNIIQGGPEGSRQSNLAPFTVEGGYDAKFPTCKIRLIIFQLKLLIAFQVIEFTMDF